TESFDCMLPTGWFQIGCKKDVPKNACYVGHHCDTYVWVLPHDVDALSRFTITVMDIATGEIHAPSRSVVRTYKGEPTPDNLETTEVTSSEVDVEALKNLRDLPMDRDRTQSSGSGFNRGLFFTPR